MKKIHYVPATRQERRRWFLTSLTLLLLSLAVGGCGFGGPADTSPTDAAASRIEAAAKRAEAAAQRVEEAAQRAEAAAQAVEAAAQAAVAQNTTSPTQNDNLAEAVTIETGSELTETETTTDVASLVEDEAAPVDLESDSVDSEDDAETPVETETLETDSEAAPVSGAKDEAEAEETGSDTPEDTETAETDSTALERAFGRDLTPDADGEPIKVGVIATLTGDYAVNGEDGLRGVEMALAEFNGQVNGRPIEIITESSDGAAPDVALDAARTLIEEEDVDILLGPLSGDEGLIIRDFAKDYPDKTFINGVAGAQDMTLRDPAPNFFRFNMDGAQWMAGLGQYVYQEKDYRRVATLADDASFLYSQVGGFVIDFCQAGGDVGETFWVPQGTTDFSGVISVLPTKIDAIYVGLSGAGSLSFLEQYRDAGGTAPLIASSITLDPSILSVEGDFADYLVGTPSAGPIAVNNPDSDWQRFVETYREMFPDGFDSPSLFAHGYYLNTKAMMFALREAEGDLSEGQQAFQEALSDMSFDSPTGPVRLNGNRQAISSNFITEVARDDDGNLYNDFVAEVPNVTQTLGLDPEAYLDLGSLSRNNPLCEDIKALVETDGNAVEAE